MLLLFRSLLPSTGLVFGRVHGLGWWENSAQGKQGKPQACLLVEGYAGRGGKRCAAALGG
jgi:hypothetical protein